MTVHIDDNLELHPDGTVTCRHCGHVLGDAERPLRDARVRETEPRTAGPSVRADASLFADRPVVLRRTLCPECLTQLQAEIVPGDEPTSRHRSWAVRP
ncbi:acetone carboxylase subunit gamma [Actinophytocola sp.]|jgi:N-methylhydantoinase B|uniref:acetone carboxylase subunit gamma n=1 Tax=Actinophytocola sp. TaxID=1872138 RepID=UPI002EDB2F4F